MAKRLFLVIGLAILAFAAGWYLSFKSQQRSQPPLELADALPVLRARHCVPATETERAIFEHALTSLEISGKNRGVLWLGIGAQRFLGGYLYRGETGKSVAVCPPPDIYARASDLLTEYKGFSARLADYQFELATKLPHRSDYLVDAIGNSAFNASRQPSEIFPRKDMRPYARMVLAGFGPKAAKYSDTALKEMSTKDSLGTSAAQVAAAAGHPEALPRIRSMMKELLHGVPNNKAIPWHTRNRLYELAYAIRFAGDRGKEFTEPLRELMSRKVQSWAPPFGMVELNPKQMCEVLEAIEGKAAIRGFGYCADISPFEQ